MKGTNKIWMSMMAFLLLGAIPALAVMTSYATSSSDSSIVANPTGQSQIGQLTWTSTMAQFFDMQSPSSSTLLSIDKYQQKNINNRIGEVLVGLAEDHFKQRALANLLTSSMLSSTNLMMVIMNRNLVVYDPNMGEIYNANHVQVTQSSSNCAQGSVCFDAVMFSSSGAVIQTSRITIFPNTVSSLVAGSGVGD